MARVYLNGADWMLTGYWKHFWDWQKPTPGQPHNRAAVPTIPAKVPGAVQLDLMAADLLPDFNIGFDSLKGEWVNNREWLYTKIFQVTPDLLESVSKDKRIYLTCLGLDYKGRIRLNGEHLGDFEGMHIPVSLDITDRLRVGREENILEIFFHQSPEVDGQIGYTSGIRTLKSRFNYVWDWCTRVVPVGIWDDIFLHVTDVARIINVFPETYVDTDNQNAEIRMQLEIDSSKWVEAEIETSLCTSNNTKDTWRWSVDLAPGQNHIGRRLPVDKVELWWPNGYGPQPLYELVVRVIIKDGGVVSDEHRQKIGFRRIEYITNDESPEGAQPYTIRVNGHRVFIQGANWVPVTPFYGKEHSREYEGLIEHFKKMNFNMFRIWGGAILEKERFYDLCDEKGILVWQEFPQSSSGIDNTPPDDPELLADLRRVATAYIKRRRHHASLAIWCGGNELFYTPDDADALGPPVDEHHPNIAMLRGLVQELDPQRMFLPASPSGPIGTPGIADFGKDLCHDVHGWWEYLGPEEHYEYYNADDSLLRSEVGTPGVSSLDTLQRLKGHLPLWPPNEMNPLWVHHGSWWIQWEEMCQLFGPWQEDEMERYVWCSQYLQGESLRYILESNRRRQWRCSGSIIWMGNEPYANTANTSIIEVWGRLKPASGFVRRAYAPYHVSLRYNKLSYKVGETFEGQAFLHNAGMKEIEGKARIQVFDVLGNRLIQDIKKQVQIPPDQTIKWDVIEFTIPEVTNSLFFLRLSLEIADKSYMNTYAFGTDAEHPLSGLKGLESTTLSVDMINFDGSNGILRLCNTGRVVAVMPVLRVKDDIAYVDPEDESQILLPGEPQDLAFTLQVGPENTLEAVVLQLEGLNVPKQFVTLH